MRGRLLALLAFLPLVVGLSSCASIVKTEGTSGPIQWRAADFKTVTREIKGQPVDTEEFTLIIKNISDKAITLTKMERIVYQPGLTPGGFSENIQWELSPGAERRLPLYSYRYCGASGGCVGGGGTQALWQITFTGTDAQNRSVEARLDIAPPPQYTKSADLSANRRSPAPEELPPLTASFQSTGVPTVKMESLANRVREAPDWRVGYAWEFRFESPDGRGTFIWSVDREQLVDGVDRKSTRLNSSHIQKSRMPSSA